MVRVGNAVPYWSATAARDGRNDWIRTSGLCLPKAALFS